MVHVSDFKRLYSLEYICTLECYTFILGALKVQVKMQRWYRIIALRTQSVFQTMRAMNCSASLPRLELVS